MGPDMRRAAWLWLAQAAMKAAQKEMGVSMGSMGGAGGGKEAGAKSSAPNGKKVLELEGALAQVSQAPESTFGQPMAVCRQGIYVEYLVEYSKCRALN
eukprot:152773-Prorocentrum_minimum.AAC.1